MENFIKNIRTPNKISPRETFMAPFQAIGLMFAEPSVFFIALFGGLLCLLSATVPVASFIIVPAIMTLIMTLVVHCIKGRSKSWKDLNKFVWAKFGLRIWVFALMILPPLLAISGSMMNLYWHYQEHQASSFYFVLIAIIFSAIWRLPLFLANTLSLKPENGIVASCYDAISTVCKNPVTIFILAIDAFLELIFIYFLVASATVMFPTLINSLGALGGNIVYWAFLSTVVTFFIGHYLVNMSIMTWQLLEERILPNDSEVETEAESES